MRFVESIIWIYRTIQLIACELQPVPGVTPDVPSSRNYEGGFKVQLMRKDINLAVTAGLLCVFLLLS